MPLRFVFGIIVVCVVAALTPSPVFAHKLIIDAQIRPDAPALLRVEAHYEPDEPVDDAKITLRTPTGETYSEGRTDANGLCQIARPKAGSYTIIADDGLGHRVEKSIDIPASESELLNARTERRNRWLMSAIGITVILAGTMAARRLRKSRT